MFKLDVLVPTYNNPQLLTQMVNSMTRIGFFENGDKRLIIINNGSQPCEKDFAHILATRNLFIVNCQDNLGWEGGLLKGLTYSDAEYVCFQNDDVHIPQAQTNFYETLMYTLREDVGLASPTTTCSAGIQSIYHQNSPVSDTDVRWVIFMCVMMRRKDLDEAGGVDNCLPGGDDIDLSIRMKKLGKRLVVNPSAFLVHHGFQTGERVNGGPDKDGGWNSRKMMERTNKALIQKHGFRTFHETISYQVV